MRNINWYQHDCFEFHKKVIFQKNKGEFRDNLISTLDEINHHNLHYIQHFSAKTLNLVNKVNSSIPNYNDLYEYSAKSFVELKNELTTNSESRIVLCQNCTLNNVNSFDHIAPKSIYGAYSIHPLNLFPSCTECNSYKSDNYLENEECRYLNLYQDTLPPHQYLFVQIDLGEKLQSAEIVYYLENRNGIPYSLFDKIKHHYEDLNLFSRFRDSSYVEISLMQDIFEDYRGEFTLEQIVGIVNKQISHEKLCYGENYWKSIFKSSLICSDDFLIDFY